MKVYHRMVGDPPSRGFDDSLVSPGFPVNAALAAIRNARISIGGVPYAGKPDASRQTPLEQHRVFEVMSIAFGQLVAVRSSVGCVGNARAHAYTDFALPTGGAEVFTDELSAAQLLSFDDFITLDWFWGLNKHVNVLDVGEWQPPEAPAFVWRQPLPPGFRESLLARYWRAASRRAFDGKTEPIRVCLGEQTDSLEIIRAAKAFFADVIIRALPGAAQNIMSMSAPVPQQQILQKFPDSALVVVYPEEKLNCEYDLRTGSFAAVGADDAAMIGGLLRGEQSPLLEGLYQRWQAEKGAASREGCSFLADYEIGLAVFRLDSGRAGAAELPSLWYGLNGRLAQSHGLGEALADKVLQGFEKKLLERLLEPEPAPSFSPGEARMLLRKALTAEEEPLLPLMEVLLSRQQAMRQEPFITNLLQERDLDGGAREARAARLLDAVLRHGFMKDLPGKAQRDPMADPGFAGFCGRHPALFKVMADYAEEAERRHPKSALFLLPVTTRFLDGFQALGRALRLLLNDHVDRLPDAETCAAVREASQEYMNDENRRLLGEYLCLCVRRHLREPDRVSETARRIGWDTGGALAAFFAWAKTDDGLLDPPPPPERLTALLDGLLPLAKVDLNAVRDGARDYVDAVMARALQTGADGFGWLTACDPRGTLLTEDFRQDRGFDYLVRARSLPSEDAFRQLLDWCSQPQGDSLIRHEAGLKDLYGSLGEAGDVQLKELIPFLRRTDDNPRIRDLHRRLIREQFGSLCEGEGFWPAVRAQREPLRKAGMGAAELLEGLPGASAAAALRKELGGLSSMDAFEAEYGRGREQEDDGFRALWARELAAAFAGRYNEMYLGECDSLEKVRRLDGLADRLRARDGLKDLHAANCSGALLEADGMIREEIPSLFGDRLVEETQRMIRGLLRLKRRGEEDEPYQLMRRLLRDHELELPENRDRIRGLPFAQQAAAGLICLSVEEGRFKAGALLKLMADWDGKALREPYAMERLDRLALISALFELLDRYGSAYAGQLCGFLLGDGEFSGYSERVRADRKRMKSYFPWSADPDGGTGVPDGAPEEMRRWLQGAKRTERGNSHGAP